MAAQLLWTFNAEDGTVGQKPPKPPLTAVTGPNIPLITDSPVFSGTKAYDVFLDRNRPTILGAVQNPYRTEARGSTNIFFEFERSYWIGIAFRRTEWDVDVRSGESWPVQVHETPSDWTNWGVGTCQQSAVSTAPIIFLNVNGQMQLRNLNNILWTKPIDIGVWHTIVLHVRWSKGSTGYIESWYDGVPQARYPTTGTRQTHRADSALNAACTPAGQPTVTFIQPIFAFGVYKWDWKIPASDPNNISTTSRRRGTIDAIRLAEDVAGNDDAGGFALVNPGGTAPDTVPPVVSSVTQTVTSTTAQIGFTTNESATTLIDYGTTTSYGQTYSNLSLVTTHSATISGLSAGTTYQYRIRSADANGNTRIEANRTFQTAAASQAVSNIAVANITKNSVTIDWDTPSAMSSVVNYGATTAYGSTVSDPTLTTHHSVTLTGLSPYTVYNYALSGTGSAGSALSSNQTTRTLSEITNVSVASLSATSTRVTWNTTRSTLSVVSYGTTQAYGQSVTETTAATSHSVTLTNLLPSATYNYQIAGDDGVGTTNLTFSTITVPEGISSIVAARGNTSITYSWVTSGAATTKVYYGRTKDYELGFVSDPTLVTSHSIVIPGLTPTTWYYTKIESVNASGAVSTVVRNPVITNSLSGIVSDVFASSTVQSFWTFVDPLANCSRSIVGGALRIAIPSGTSHDFFTGALNAPRLRQATTGNTNFDIQTYLGSTPSLGNQSQGFLVEQDSQVAVRFSFGYNGTSNPKHFYCASFTAGTATTRYNSNVPTQTYPAYLRLQRVGNDFTAYRSNDGYNWSALVTFTFAMTANFVGLLALTAGTNPAFNADFNNFLVDAPVSGTSVSMDYVEPSNDSYEIPIGVVNSMAISFTDGVGDEEDIFSVGITTQKFVPSRAHNRVAETTTSTGTGHLTLLGKIAKHKAFSDRYAVNESVVYGIEHETADEFEIGQGHLKTNGIFVRDICEESSNGDDFVNFSAGVKRIYCCTDANLYNELQAEADRV